jgi:hypothetical protein
MDRGLDCELHRDSADLVAQALRCESAVVVKRRNQESASSHGLRRREEESYLLIRLELWGNY